MYFKTISLDSVPIHVLADQFTTFLTLFNSLWLNFSFVLSLRMSSYLSRSQKKFSSILHGWFFFLSVILYFLTDIRIGCFFYLCFDNTCWKRKSIPEIFCVRWRRTQFIIFWVLCFFWEFFVDRLQFLRHFDWVHTSYAQRQSRTVVFVLLCESWSGYLKTMSWFS